MENLTSYVFRALWGGPFWLRVCLPTSQIQADNLFAHLKFKMLNYFGSVSSKKLLRLKIGIVNFVHLAHVHQPKFCRKSLNFTFQC